MLKRILALALSVLMLTTLAVPVFADTTQDGDNQQGEAGSDIDKDNGVDKGAFGCWRLYMATYESGQVVGAVTDVGNVGMPSVPEGKYFTGTKLQTQGGTSGRGNISYGKRDDVPPLGSDIGTLKAYWEQDNYKAIRGMSDFMGWSEEHVQKFIAGEYVIVMEPVGWFKFAGEMYSMSATEVANFDAKLAGMLKLRLGSFTHNELPGYAWLKEKEWWDIPIGHSYSTDGMKFWLQNSEIQSTFGISVVYANGGMCCPHDPQNCLCYKNAKPPNTDPPSAPANCKCFKTHLKPNSDPAVKPIPCGPGVKDCDCYPPQCCPHPPTCPCGPGEHPENDPNCECPETHPGVPCDPELPDCDCFPDPEEVTTKLIIHEDEMTQALSAKMEAKGTKFVVVPMPPFQPSAVSGTEITSSCTHYTHKDHDHCNGNGSWIDHNFSSSMFYGPTTTQLQEVTSMNRTNLGITAPQDQYKAMGLLTGEMTLKYANNQLTAVYPGIMGMTPGGPFDKENIFHFIGHRQGAGKTPIPIAAYMTATAKNLDYKTFINERVNNWTGYPSIPGYQPMEGFKGLTDSGKGSYNFTVKYEAALANGVRGDPSEKVIINGSTSPTMIIHQFFQTIATAHASPGSGCTRSKSDSWPSKYGCCSDILGKANQYNGDFVLTGILPRTNFKWDVRVDGTVVAPPKANAALSQKETFGVVYNKDDFYKIQSSIPTWKFYPTFQMTWDGTPAAPKEDKDVWALAAGERTFNAYDALTIYHQSARIGMVAPWSRDFEDRAHDVNVTKAGTAYKAESGTNQILVDAYVTVIDPNFVHPDQRPTIIADNQRRIEEYATAIETIVAASEDNWGMYTNLRAGSSKEAAYVVPFVASDKNQEELVKTQMKRTLRGYGHTAIDFEAFRTDGNVTGTDYTVPQAYSVRGWDYTSARVGIPASINTLTKAQTNLSELLHDAPGKSWYNEDYEGIIVVHLSAIATLKQGMIIEYASIYRHESDWQTEYNANSKPLVNKYMGIYKIPKGKYGVGVDFKVPSFSVGGKGVSGLNVGSKIYEFGVRGNVFDDT